MNGYNLFPPMSVYCVDPKIWGQILPGQSFSFERCHEEISAAGRRLLKGINRSQERIRLLQWSEQLRDLARETRRQGGLREIPIPEAGAAHWIHMLTFLAKHNAWLTAREFEKEQVPPFLPCIWAPPEEESPAGSFSDDLNVRTHLLELHRMKTHFERHVQGRRREVILEGVTMRLNFFKDALDHRNGIVEIVGTLTDSYLTEG